MFIISLIICSTLLYRGKLTLEEDAKASHILNPLVIIKPHGLSFIPSLHYLSLLFPMDLVISTIARKDAVIDSAGIYTIRFI